MFFKSKIAIKEQQLRINEQQQKINEQQQKINGLEERVNQLNNEMKDNHEKSENDFKHMKGDVLSLGRRRDDDNKKVQAVARDLIRTKWRLIDFIGTYEKEISCKICGFSAMEHEFKTVETDCIFDGGHLKRYICPSCGVIFGPRKFDELTEKEHDDDYTVHYISNNEGDCTDKELRAFYLLNPNHEGCYLNFGCGHWSNSLRKLHEDGFLVYGYEPYSPDIDNPYIITDEKQLKGMLFDGIYSNDMLEHMMDPVESLRFMRTLLRGPESLMAHSTSCYIYKYEYTRFHTHFFTGRSLEIMSQRAALKVIDYMDDEKENDFICAVFKPDMRASYLDWAYTLKGKQLRSKEISLEPGEVMYGPYIRFWPGQYTLLVEYLGEVNAVLGITAEQGKKQLYTFNLEPNKNIINFSLKEEEFDVEFVIHDHTAGITVKQLTITEYVSL